MSRRTETAPEGQTLSLFVTTVYRSRLGGPASLIEDLTAAALSLAEDDHAGAAWCEENGYLGYTSYASLNDLVTRMPAFQELATALAPHVAAFAEAAAFDLGRRKLMLDSLWVNVLPEGAGHSGHIHPHAVVSGTVYVAVPDGASALKLEDPRLGMMMAAPGRLREAPQDRQPFVYLSPAAGDVILWESWLRHEVPPNRAEDERISVSFNYRWE